MKPPVWIVAQVDEEDAEWKVDLGNGLISYRAELCVVKGEVLILENDTGVYLPYMKLSERDRLRALQFGKRFNKKEIERRIIRRPKQTDRVQKLSNHLGI